MISHKLPILGVAKFVRGLFFFCNLMNRFGSIYSTSWCYRGERHLRYLIHDLRVMINGQVEAEVASGFPWGFVLWPTRRPPVGFLGLRHVASKWVLLPLDSSKISWYLETPASTNDFWQLIYWVLVQRSICSAHDACIMYTFYTNNMKDASDSSNAASKWYFLSKKYIGSHYFMGKTWRADSIPDRFPLYFFQGQDVTISPIGNIRLHAMQEVFLLSDERMSSNKEFWRKTGWNPP